MTNSTFCFFLKALFVLRYLFIYQSIYLFIHLFIYLFIYSFLYSRFSFMQRKRIDYKHKVNFKNYDVTIYNPRGNILALFNNSAQFQITTSKTILSMISSIKSLVNELPHELPNDLRLKTLELGNIKKNVKCRWRRSLAPSRHSRN